MKADFSEHPEHGRTHWIDDAVQTSTHQYITLPQYPPPLHHPPAKGLPCGMM
ncbi:hypothetical protein ABFO74_00235 [Acinetobacter baumannii]